MAVVTQKKCCEQNKVRCSRHPGQHIGDISFNFRSEVFGDLYIGLSLSQPASLDVMPLALCDWIKAANSQTKARCLAAWALEALLTREQLQRNLVLPLLQHSILSLEDRWKVTALHIILCSLSQTSPVLWARANNTVPIEMKRGEVWRGISVGEVEEMESKVKSTVKIDW